MAETSAWCEPDRASLREVVVGMGANLGCVRQNLSLAVGELRRLGTVTGVAWLYRTAPVGGPPQPHFLNTAARLATSRALEPLLDELLAIERAAGRDRGGSGERFGPRILDLDILWAGSEVAIDAPRLVVPHPRLHQRLFALLPLLDLVPDAKAPAGAESYVQVARALGDQGVVRLEGPDWWRGDEPAADSIAP